ncbi:thermonuclease family protein [Sphingomonas sp.]|jgi:endonuclease YncB( thermonuclease family)|uniref:thermonuclease family protein n=1 Tax=Sphingomonas sp. TaxID=28214 RepID=UPI002602F3C8|nr:thermonuclease family protein [Sphingomonas sp.]MDF2603491.1 hypothetical protein [Sphingomonas sp.]
MIALALAAAAVVPASKAFACTPVRVWGGDGPIWYGERRRIRLAGIAAREIDGTCRRGHLCPKASGIKARDTLVQLLGGPRGRARSGHVLVRGPKLRCRSRGPDRYGRTLAICARQGGDLGEALVRAGEAKGW